MNYIFKVLPFFFISVVFSQACQVINTNLESVFPVQNAEGIVQVCLNETISIEGSATFEDNDQTGVVYEWDLGNGTRVSGLTTTFSYATPGIYFVKLIVSGTTRERCDASVNINLVIQVADVPDFSETGAANTVGCLGDVIRLEGQALPKEVVFNCTPPVGTLTTLPDGIDIPYETSIFVDCFEPSDVLTSINQIESICLNIEHSFLGDLSISINSPNGQRVLLHNRTGGSANLGIPWAIGTVDSDSSNLTPGIGHEYCFLPGRTLPTLSEGVAPQGVFPNGGGPGTYLDSFVPEGNYRSESPLDGLLGSPLNGEWVIQIIDHLRADNGTIFEWRLEFTSSILPVGFSVTPEIVSQSWDADALIVSRQGNAIEVQPESVGNHCFTYRAVDEFGCEYTEDVCIDILEQVTLSSNIIGNEITLTQCDDDADGITHFNLTEIEATVSPNFAAETFTYFETLESAEAGDPASIIENSTSYLNAIPVSGSSVYVRVENSNTCFEIVKINLQVSVSQIPSTFSILNYFICDDDSVDNDATNGIAAFNFSNATEIIENLFPAPRNFTITYYSTERDALEEMNPITNISNYRNESSPFVQDIFVRIDQNDTNACVALGHHITLNVNPIPQTNIITAATTCSASALGVFDLTAKESEIVGNETRPILVSYHITSLDASNNTNPILNPETYSSTTGETIFVRAQFDDNQNGILDAHECVNTSMFFDLIVNPSPILITPMPINLCSETVMALADLTQREDEITGGNSNISLRYFSNLGDINANTPILDPLAYTTTQLSTIIYVEATGINGCTTVTELKVNVALLDDLNPLPSPIGLCESDNDGFDVFNLTIREAQILNGLDSAQFTFRYYENMEDAALATSNFITTPLRFENTQQREQDIYASVTSNISGCIQVARISLIVNQLPNPDLDAEYVVCLNRNGDFISSVENTLIEEVPIDTNLNDNDFNFQWYLGTEVAASNLIPEATNSIFSPNALATYTVVITNIETGCEIIASTNVIGSFPPESISAEVTTAAFSSNDVINVNVVGNGEYEFSLDGIEWQSSNTFENVIGGTYTVRVRDIYGCNMLEIECLNIIDYPRVFTPNGDGVNDIWNVKGIAKQQNLIINIFDRGGKFLKQIRSGSSGWDGTFNGKNLPTDDYWFYVELDDINIGNVRRELTGHFTLKR